MSNRYPILSVLTVQEANRFWRHVLVTENDDCWIWQRARVKKNYGGYSIHRAGKIIVFITSRIAYALHYGSDPGEMDVLHKCDTPLCCNPRHLFLGTNQDNIADRVQKGRSAKGDNHWSRRNPEKTSKGQSHGRSKLKDHQVIAIRQRYAIDHIPRKIIAQEFNVTVATINLIVMRKIWKHI